MKNLQLSSRASQKWYKKKDREFSRSMPEEQIKLRDEIIAVGFPGDPIVRKMWRMRPSEKRRK